MDSSLEVRGKTAIKLIGESVREQQIGNGSSANTLLRNSSGGKIEGAIGRIFTSLLEQQ
jgi:hypothetical protein